MSILPIKTKIKGPAPVEINAGKLSFSLLSYVDIVLFNFVCLVTSPFKNPRPYVFSFSVLSSFSFSPKETEDIIDETLNYFRANMLFRNFEVRGPADRLLVYLTLYAHQALTRLPGKDKDAAGKVLYQLAIENFPIPGDKNFVLGGLVQNPKDRAESGLLAFFFFKRTSDVQPEFLIPIFSFRTLPSTLHPTPSRSRIEIGRESLRQ